jgi:hypothetical protein
VLRALLALLILSSAACLAAGCVLLLDDPPDPLGANCRFKGDATTDCGKCIAKSCRKQVNACCIQGGSCDEQLTRLDECASNPSEAHCVHLSVFNPNAPPSSQPLNACVETNCADACPVKAAAQCPGLSSMDCFACCNDKFAAGRNSSFNIDIHCACTPGYCTPECGLTAYCVSGGRIPGGPADVCLTCLSDESVYGGKCPFTKECSDDPDCLLFTTCFEACSGS